MGGRRQQQPQHLLVHLNTTGPSIHNEWVVGEYWNNHWFMRYTEHESMAKDAILLVANNSLSTPSCT